MKILITLMVIVTILMIMMLLFFANCKTVEDYETDMREQLKYIEEYNKKKNEKRKRKNKMKNKYLMMLIGMLFLYPTTVMANNNDNNNVNNDTYMYVIANSGLNIREAETTESNIIKALPKGTKVEITSTDNPEWYAIKYDDIEGYMYSEWLNEEKPVVATSTPTSNNNVTQSKGRLYGTCSISHYCNCSTCSGSYGNTTASGATPSVNRTVAMGRNIPFGTKIRIGNDPTVYTVEDRGGAIGRNNVDVFVGSHSEAMNKGRYSAPVYIVE